MSGKRIAFLGGLAAGFVLGARAGRERYEQIKQVSRRVAEHPATQQAAGAVQAQASGLAKTAQQKVNDRMPKVAETVGNRIPGMRPKDTSPGQQAKETQAPANSSRAGSGTPPAN